MSHLWLKTEGPRPPLPSPLFISTSFRGLNLLLPLHRMCGSRDRCMLVQAQPHFLTILTLEIAPGDILSRFLKITFP